MKNSQGIPVCKDHKDSTLKNMKCMCGGHLDMLEGKFGVFFNCLRCGNINMRKALEMNPQMTIDERQKDTVKNPEKSQARQIKFAPEKKNPIKDSGNESRHQIVRSDDPRYFD